MIYNTIIEAIATGSSKMDSDKCSRYINSLIELRIIEKEPGTFHNGIKQVNAVDFLLNYKKRFFRMIFILKNRF